MPQVIQFGTMLFSTATDYNCQFNADSISGFTAQVESRTRRGRSPIRDAIHGDARSVELYVWKQNTSKTTAEFWSDIYETFNPLLGARTMKIVHDRTGGTVQVDVDVLSVKQSQESNIQVFNVTVQAQDPIWRAPTQSNGGTATSGTAAVTGDAPALPTWRCLPTFPNIRRRRITVADRSGRGLANYWCRTNFDTSGLALTGESDFIVYYKGRSIPFFVGAGYGTAYGSSHLAIGGTNTAIDFRVDVPANSDTYIDVFYSAYLNNTATANRFDEAQIDYSGGNGSGSPTPNNGTITWNSWLLSNAPQGACFSWTPAKTGQNISGVSYGLVTEGNLQASFAVLPDATLQNDADSAVVVLGSGGTVLKGLERQFLPRVNAANESQLFTAGGTVGYFFQFLFRDDAGNQSYSPLVAQNANAVTVSTAFENIYGVGNVGVANGTSGVWQVTWTGGTWAQRSIPQVEMVNPTDANASLSWNTVTEGQEPSCRAYVRYRLPGQVNWTTGWSTTTAGTYTSDVGLNPAGGSGGSAVMLAVGIEPLTAAAAGTLNLRAAPYVHLHPSYYPTVTAGTAGTAWYVNGTLSNSTNGKYVVFENVLMDNDVLAIDCLEQRITTEGTTPWYGSVRFSDPDNWLSLDIGNNSWTTSFTTAGAAGGTTAGTVTFNPRWYERWPL